MVRGAAHEDQEGGSPSQNGFIISQRKNRQAGQRSWLYIVFIPLDFDTALSVHATAERSCSPYQSHVFFTILSVVNANSRTGSVIQTRFSGWRVQYRKQSRKQNTFTASSTEADVSKSDIRKFPNSISNFLGV